MGKKFSKKFDIEFGERLQRAKDDPTVQKWWDGEQAPLDLGLMQGENDLGLKWDELSDDHKRELILKIQSVSPSGVSYKKYGRFQADTIISARKLWRTLGEKSVFGVVDREDLELKKELRKLGVTDPSGTVLHEGRRLWKDLSNLEKMKVSGKYLNMKDEEKIKAQEEELEKLRKEKEERWKQYEEELKLAKRKAKWGF